MNQALFWTFATILSALTCAALIVPYLWFRRATGERHERRRLIGAIAASLGLPAVAMGIYSWLGSPALVPTGAPTAAPIAHPGAQAMQPGQKAGDLQTAIDSLERRLRDAPDDADGWQLLAQSYAFVGRDADAATAQARADALASGQAPATMGTVTDRNSQDIAALAERTRRNPKDARAWAQLAEVQRRARNFTEAIACYEKVVALKAMNADLWADYADASAAARGRLDAKSEPLIRAALKLDPEHVKALWLLGSLQTEQKNPAAALATWQRLSQLLPPDSSDARIIAANIEEARSQLGGGAAPRPLSVSAAKSGGAAVSVSGEVLLDPRLRNRVSDNAVLFVVAKVSDQPGPPLAALRSVVRSWPVRFVLDETSAMMPGRTIADFTSIVIEARISRSGTAEPQTGDLRGRSASFDPRAGKPVRLLIQEEIG